MAGFWILSKWEMQHATAKAASALVWAKWLLHFWKESLNIQRCSQAGGNVGEQVSKTNDAHVVIAEEAGLLAAQRSAVEVLGK